MIEEVDEATRQQQLAEEAMAAESAAEFDRHNKEVEEAGGRCLDRDCYHNRDGADLPF